MDTDTADRIDDAMLDAKAEIGVAVASIHEQQAGIVKHLQEQIAQTAEQDRKIAAGEAKADELMTCTEGREKLFADSCNEREGLFHVQAALAAHGGHGLPGEPRISRRSQRWFSTRALARPCPETGTSSPPGITRSLTWGRGRRSQSSRKGATTSRSSSRPSAFSDGRQLPDPAGPVHRGRIQQGDARGCDLEGDGQVWHRAGRVWF